MKEMAIFKLGKSLLAKAGEKFEAKKQVWAEQAAISKEETARREVEFKEDYKVLKENIAETTAKAKVEAKKGIEMASKAKDDIQTKLEEKKAQKALQASAPEVKVETESKPKVKTTVEKKSQTDEKESQKKSASKKKTVDKKRSSEAKVEKKESAKTSTNKKEVTTEASPKKETKAKATTEKKDSKKETKSTKPQVTPTATTTKKKAEPSKTDIKMALYTKDVTKHYGSVDTDFLALVVKNLGPSIHKKDAELVSCSDPKELETVRKNFLVKKLGMTERAEVLDATIAEVCAELKAARTKYRATFYYALAKKVKKESALS